MVVTVEFFGIPRARSGVPNVRLEFSGDGITCGDLFRELAGRFPALADECFVGNALRPGYAANCNGEFFVTSPTVRLVPDSHLLILSADAGG